MTQADMRRELKRLREEAGYTTRQVADRLNTSAAQITRIETGRIASPSWALIIRLAWLYGADVNTLARLSGVDVGSPGDLDPTITRALRAYAELPPREKAMVIDALKLVLAGLEKQQAIQIVT